MKVLGAVWLPGFGSALSSVGFGAMIAFSSLLFAERGWSPLWLTFSAFAIALVAARLFLGHTPDKLGGAKVWIGPNVAVPIGWPVGLATNELRVRGTPAQHWI